DRARPAMRDQQWQGMRVARLDVDEVDVETVEPRLELRKRVELRFRLAPVVLVAPVGDQRLQLRELNTLRLIGDGLLVRPARRTNTVAQIDDRVFGDVDLEWSNRGVGCRVAHGSPLRGGGR